MQKIKIVFLGTGPVAATSLKSLIENFDIELVITKNRRHARDAAPVEDLAIEHNLPIKFANTTDELNDLITTIKIQSQLGVVVDYGVIASRQTIDTFPLGIINSHFSMLPEWRGADPITFAILSGQAETGVSLMLVDPTLDTGKLLAQKSLLISPDDTTPSLTNKLVELSDQLLTEYIPLYINGKVEPQPQSHPENATYSRLITKADGQLDPSTMTADECERKIRAFVGWPKTRLEFHGQEIIITKAKVLPNFAGDNWPDVIKCADNTFLQIVELVNPKSGKKMRTTDYLRGLK